MQPPTSLKALSVILGLFACTFANATMVQQMNLGELALNADKIFRGTVTSVENGTVTLGGGELPTVKYVIRVSETFKGDTTSANDKAGDVVEVMMLGRQKQATSDGDIQHFIPFQPPAFEQGKEYLLFTTAPSSVGLSMTVGVGQGAFDFVDENNVMNAAKNAGLFRDMDSTGMPQRGPIPFAVLAERIRSLIGN